jgi:hypothetical protein
MNGRFLLVQKVLSIRHNYVYVMSKKSEIIKVGLMTALIAFVAISAFAIVVAPGAIANPVYAFRSQMPDTDGGPGHSNGNNACYWC